MNEFIFDLQRFADYEMTAGGESVEISASGTTKTFSVTNGTETKNYSVNVNGTAVVSAGSDGLVRVNVTSGYIRDFSDLDAQAPTAFVLTGGTTRNYYPSQVVILGEDGPKITNVRTGNSTYPVVITLTTYTDYNTVTLTCSQTSYTVKDFTIGTFNYVPPVATSSTPATINLKIQNGKTYLDIAEDDTSRIDWWTGAWYTAYTPVSGTITLAFDNDGSESYVTGLEQGDSFQYGTVTGIMGNSRLAITDDETIKFWNQSVDSTTLIPLSSLNFDSEDFTTMTNVLIDGTDYYTVLNPGLVPLLTDGTGATQITGTSNTATSVAIGVSDTQITMGVPTKYSPSTVAQILFDIAPSSSGSQMLYVYFPYAPPTFCFRLTLTSGGSLVVDAYNDSSQLDTTGAINLANYGVDLTAPIRLMLQAQFARNNSGKTFVTLNVGSYTRKQQLSANVIFNGSNCSYRFVSESNSTIYISNIIARDESIGKLTERIVALPVSTTDTDMTESNGLYTAGAVGESILQTPDVDDLVQTYGASSVVTGILVVGNPAYKTGDILTTLTSIDKTGGTVTDHNTFTLDSSVNGVVSDSWATNNKTLNDLANMQFGWKAGT